MKKWYAAHTIMYMKLKEGTQAEYTVYENVILLEAESDDEAEEKAIRRGHDEEGDSDNTLRYGDRPATMVFAGVRKVVACVDPESRPGDGTEITYSVFEVRTPQELSDLASGNEVHLSYKE